MARQQHCVLQQLYSPRKAKAAFTMGDMSPPAASVSTNPPHPLTNTTTTDDRAALRERDVPRMTLSTANNPLTAPLPPQPSTIATERATARFAITGHCILTGGAGTLALASARALLEHGASGIALFDLPSTLESSAAAIQDLQASFPDRVISTQTCNVTSPDSVTEAFEITIARHGGRISTLCCFAGIVGCVPSMDSTASHFRNVLDVNLTGSFLCAQAFARHFRQTTPASDDPSPAIGGSILFTASISSHATNFPQPQTAYNVSKAGVVQMTKNLAAEWAVFGIRVNCVSPGYLDTVLNAGDKLKELRDIWAQRCPMARMGDVEEIVGTVVLLCSARAGRYMTGSEVVVDGGALCF